jgi:hypothetical protein
MREEMTVHVQHSHSKCRQPRREEMTVQHIHSKCRQPRREETLRKINNCVARELPLEK